MSKLKTPLGTIRVFDNNKEVEYTVAKLDVNPTIFPDLNGRFKIIVEYENDQLSHFISCTLDGIDYRKAKCEIEPGERLECKSIYQGNIKLSIGIECESCYLNGKRVSDYDYDSEYINNGIGYTIFPTTKSQTFIFGLAWIKEYNKTNEVQTWFGADPTII